MSKPQPIQTNSTYSMGNYQSLGLSSSPKRPELSQEFKKNLNEKTKSKSKAKTNSKTKPKTRSKKRGKKNSQTDEDLGPSKEIDVENPDPVDEMKTIDDVLKHHISIAYFEAYLIQSQSQENILFYQAVKKFQSIRDPEQMREEADKIISIYMAENGKYEINIDSPTKRKAINTFQDGKVTKNIFDESLDHVIHLMKTDKFISFTKSPEYKELSKDWYRIKNSMMPIGPETPRNGIFQEFYSHEKEYSLNLSTFIDRICKPLSQDNGAIMSQEDFKKLFFNIQEIFNFSIDFLTDLDEKKRNWNYKECVGDLFLKFKHNLKTLYVPYFNNFKIALQTFNEKIIHNKSALNFLRKHITKDIDIESMLNLPNLQLDAYKEFIDKMIHASSEFHPDIQYLEEAKKFITELNLDVSKQQVLRVKLDEKSEKIMTQLTLVKINQGKVIQYSFDKSKESKVVQLFLFKQFLAWGFQIEASDNDTNQRQESQHNLKNSDKIYRLDYIVPINAIWLNESPDGYDNDYGSVLEIITPERNLLIALTHKMNFMHKIFDVMVQYFHIDIQDIISKQYRLLKFFFTNQIVFEGEMLNGKSKGKAKLIYPNGTVYDGGVIAGLKEGPGQITFFCNDTFSGNWTKNKVSGQFTLKYVSGNMLSTSYSHKNPQEYGEFVSPSAGNYQGNFSDFKFHGKGSFTFSNGDKYIGSFQRNMRHDYGGLVCKDGSEYAGYWVNDMRSGKEGTQIYPNGDVYEGEWLNNLRHGNGKFSSHKTTYYGEWKNDLKHGKGKLFYSRDNVKYFGQFENGLRSGNGRFINGNWRYIGEWERNYPNGKGELIICNKKIVENEEENKNNLVKKYSGIFRFGKPYDENMKCIEKSLQFEGQIEFGVKKGYGKIIFPNGNKIISIFNSGLPSQEEELSIHFSENQNKKESTILKYTNTRVEFEQNSLDNERSNLLQKLARQVNTIEPINESIICWLSPPEHEQTLEWF